MANSNGNKDVDSLIQHEKYYLPGGDLHLLVENTLFRVHSYFFTRESSMLKPILETPMSPGRDREPEGSSDSSAIRLKNVTPEQLAQFLWVFYDPKYSHVTTVEHWTVVLDLACRWGFSEVKALAIRCLETLDIPVISRIALYQKYDASVEILSPHYAVLCSRPETLTIDETNALGNPTTVMIFSIREKILSSQTGVKTLDKMEPKIFQRVLGSYFLSQKKKADQKEENDKNQSDSKANGKNSSGNGSAKDSSK